MSVPAPPQSSPGCMPRRAGPLGRGRRGQQRGLGEQWVPGKHPAPQEGSPSANGTSRSHSQRRREEGRGSTRSGTAAHASQRQRRRPRTCGARGPWGVPRGDFGAWCVRASAEAVRLPGQTFCVCDLRFSLQRLEKCPVRQWQCLLTKSPNAFRCRRP